MHVVDYHSFRITRHSLCCVTKLLRQKNSQKESLNTKAHLFKNEKDT